MLRLLFVGIVAVAIAEEVTHDGACPDMKPVENFNLTAYQGLWYEMGKWQNGKWLYGKCKQVEYKLDGEVVKVKNTQVGNGIPTSIEGIATYAPDAGKSANFVITFTFGDAVRANPLMVLQTDYTSYSIGYNCKYDEKKKTHQITAWVLSRSQALPSDARATVEAFLKSKTKEIDASKLLPDISETCMFNGTAIITEPVKQ